VNTLAITFYFGSIPTNVITIPHRQRDRQMDRQ